jgi:hypothetical protein
MGPWFAKVNAAVALVGVGDTAARLIDLLGPPDEVRRDAGGPGRQLQSMMQEVAGGPTSIQYGGSIAIPEVWVYRDPYRPRKRYAFGLRDGAISERWTEITSDANL